jgi:hypothetical protein
MEGIEPLTPATAGAAWNPWNWRVGNLHVTPITLMATSGVLAWTRTGSWRPCRCSRGCCTKAIRRSGGSPPELAELAIERPRGAVIELVVTGLQAVGRAPNLGVDCPEGVPAPEDKAEVIPPDPLHLDEDDPLGVAVGLQSLFEGHALDFRERAPTEVSMPLFLNCTLVFIPAV